MGCYDMIVGDFVCPYCNTVERIVLDQTKAGKCIFKDLTLGDYIPGLYEDCKDKGQHTCKNCNRTYSYEVDYGNKTMYSIKIFDKVFNKTYTYKNKNECVPKIINEQDLNNMADRLKRYKEVLNYNIQKRSQADKVINEVTNKIDVLQMQIGNQVNKKYGLA